jgi:hypothetical protein
MNSKFAARRTQESVGADLAASEAPIAVVALRASGEGVGAVRIGISLISSWNGVTVLEPYI